MREARSSVNRPNTVSPFLVLLFLLPLIQSCAGIAEGITKGLLESGGQTEKLLDCEVTGSSFEGVEGGTRRKTPETTDSPDTSSPSMTKVMYVHGMGSPKPGHSARLQENLTRALGLTRMERRPKEIALRSPLFKSDPLGTLMAWRYFDESGSRELVFFELTWSVIADVEKEALAYDTSGQYDYKRATLNQYVKTFLNTRMSDPVIYTGKSHDKILASVVEGTCWMFYANWDELPDQQAVACDWVELWEPSDLLGSELAFITHSMGSRVLVDTLQRDADTMDEYLESHRNTTEGEKARQMLDAFKNKELRVYMLANQLPLMQMGRDVPQVTGQREAYCQTDGAKYDERILNKFSIVAFSDPNDVLSYAIPPRYSDEYMNSRLCPSIVNVNIQLVPVTTLFDVGEFANPFEAHTGYDNDSRVIGMIARGFGEKNLDENGPAVCTWLETIEN